MDNLWVVESSGGNLYIGTEVSEPTPGKTVLLSNCAIFDSFSDSHMVYVKWCRLIIAMVRRPTEEELKLYKAIMENK